jgi:divinyl chlorophyllide a 8-vinyl-reductase
MDTIVAALMAVGRLVPSVRDKAQLAKIGRYYATESMLVWDAARGRYDAAATPAYGRETLEEFYTRVLAEGLQGQELGDHAVFSRQREP